MASIEHFISESAEEVWESIPAYPAYEVSSHGRVRSYWSGPSAKLLPEPQRILTPLIDNQGYERVVLTGGGDKKMFGIHSLVMLAFVGPRPEGYQTCHWDGNPRNNHLSNLRYDTPSGNRQDSQRHGSYGGNRDIHPWLLTTYCDFITESELSELMTKELQKHGGYIVGAKV